MFATLAQSPIAAIATVLALVAPVAQAMELTLCKDDHFLGGCAVGAPLKYNMPMFDCYANRGGGSWTGFGNDVISSFRVKGGCCRFFADDNCRDQMFIACENEGDGDIASITGRYGAQYNDRLSSVYCYDH